MIIFKTEKNQICIHRMKPYSKFQFLSLMLMLCITMHGQSLTEIESELKKLSLKDSTVVLNALAHLNYELIKIELLDDNTPKEFKKLKKGEYVTLEQDNATFIYYLMGKLPFEEYRANYIYIDGSIHSSTAVDSLRAIILKSYESGDNFEDLATEYTMDGNSKGDLPWFKKGHMMLPFEEAVRNHKLNDIFTVDIPERNWYYVTLKTYANRVNSELSFLKIKATE